MSILYRQICNCCGKWGNEGENSFPHLEVDLTNYVLFSCGLTLKEPKIKLNFCKECYSKSIDLSFKYQTGEELVRLRDLMKDKDKELEAIKSEFREYTQSVKRLLKPVGLGGQE